MNSRVWVTCCFCGKTFRMYTAVITENNLKMDWVFCSGKCRNQSLKPNIITSPRIFFCGDKKERNRKYWNKYFGKLTEKQKNARRERARIYARNKRAKESPKEREQYRLTHLDYFRAKYRRHYHRKKQDAKFRINKNLKNRIRASLRLVHRKLGGWSEYLGYDIIALKKHLESQWLNGMSWQNYGQNGWHIDHKIPVSFFEYKSPNDVEFKMCWRLENLQPMWRNDNITKSNKLLPEFICQ